MSNVAQIQKIIRANSKRKTATLTARNMNNIENFVNRRNSEIFSLLMLLLAAQWPLRLYVCLVGGNKTSVQAIPATQAHTHTRRIYKIHSKRNANKWDCIFSSGILHVTRFMSYILFIWIIFFLSCLFVRFERQTVKK